MKDPLEIMGAETIFVMEYYSGNVLEEYENMNKFKAGLMRKKYKLPYSWDGTGAVVYGQHLCYNRWTVKFFCIRKQGKYNSIKMNETDNFINLLFFAEHVSGFDQAKRIAFDICKTTFLKISQFYIAKTCLSMLWKQTSQG